MKENTAKNFVIQLGSLIALYVSISALMVLIFGIINIKFPDEIFEYWAQDSAREGVRIGIAMVLIFFPTYLVLTRMSNQNRRREEGGKYSGLAKWLVYLSLLVSGAIILGDLVTILIYLLNGEITVRFALKAFTLLFVLIVTFSYYLLDIRAYFARRVDKSYMFAGGASVLVAIAVLFGFMNVETPSEVRQMKLDQQQIADLQEIQWRIEDHYRIHEILPPAIDVLYEEEMIPEAPTDREAYQYRVTDPTHYELCATFEFPSSQNDTRKTMYSGYERNNNWSYSAGEKCFERMIIEDTQTTQKI
jgi:hypothetical protein